MNNFQAGKYIDAGGYKAFMPELVNRAFNVNDPEILTAVEQAGLLLGELNASSGLVPDVDQFIRLHVIKEAILSSRIEGTQTRMEEVLLREEEVNPERRNDWREVNNYIEAMNSSINMLPVLPLSSQMLKTAHRILLKQVRGENRMPGEFRRSQNWIGGTSLQDALYIPPVWHEVDRLMGDLENFIHNPSSKLPHVLRIAIAHYQFETIHPFLDGNGRIGRLLITLYFINAGVLKKPVLYLSEFLDHHRDLYYDNLMKVRNDNSLDRWLKFFLNGIIETCRNATDSLGKILELKKDCESNKLPKLGRKMPSALKVMDHLYRNPVIRPDEMVKITELSSVSVYKLINDFEKHGILVEATGHKRNRIFIFRDYLAIFDELYENTVTKTAG